MDSILVVEDTDSLRDVLAQVLRTENYEVTTAPTAEEALEIIAKQEFSMVLSDLKLPGLSGLELVAKIRENNRRVPIIVMTAYGSIDTAVDAMKVGATDFITKPFDPQALCTLISQVIEHRRIIDRSMHSANKPFLTQSIAVEAMLEQAQKVAPLSSPVLILGESGTGKELVARYIHDHSLRHEKPFIGVNCGSMPSDLLESEFFGHEEGAFTGANEQRTGLFEIANNGTIFLDEIGNMPATLQAKLLRTLQESEIKKLGSTKYQKIDTRVISATNCNIEKEIESHSFREDLYYRLSVMVLEIPPLRERKEDVSLLTKYFLKTFSQEFKREIPKITPSAMQALESYSWPGNVRELENTICRALIMNPGNEIDTAAFEIKGMKTKPNAKFPQKTLPEAVAEAVQRTESEMISNVLAQTGGNKTRAAEILGVSYKTLLNKTKEYNINISSEGESSEVSASV